MFYMKGKLQDGKVRRVQVTLLLLVTDLNTMDFGSN